MRLLMVFQMPTLLVFKVFKGSPVITHSKPFCISDIFSHENCFNFLFCMCVHTCTHDTAFMWLLENSVRWHSCCPPYLRQGFCVFLLCVSGQLGHKFSGNCLCLPPALRSSGIRDAHTVSEFWVLGISTETLMFLQQIVFAH